MIGVKNLNIYKFKNVLELTSRRSHGRDGEYHYVETKFKDGFEISCQDLYINLKCLEQ